MSNKVSSGNTKDTAKDTRKSSLESTASKLAKLSREFQLFAQRFTSNVDNVEAVSKVNDYLEEKIYELYVATTGSDTTGDGSQNNPYASITKAIAHAKQLFNLRKNYVRAPNIYYDTDYPIPFGALTNGSALLAEAPVVINVEDGVYDEQAAHSNLISDDEAILIVGRKDLADTGIYPNQETATNTTGYTIEVDHTASGTTPWPDEYLKGKFFLSEAVGYGVGVIADNTYDGGTNTTTIKITPGAGKIDYYTHSMKLPNGAFRILENKVTIKALRISGERTSIDDKYNLALRNVNLEDNATDQISSISRGWLNECMISAPNTNNASIYDNRMASCGFFLFGKSCYQRYLGNCYIDDANDFAGYLQAYNLYTRCNMRANYSSFGRQNSYTYIINNCVFDTALITTKYMTAANPYIMELRVDNTIFVGESGINIEVSKATFAHNKFADTFSYFNIGIGGTVYDEGNEYYAGAVALITDYFISLASGGRYIFENGQCEVTGASNLGNINGGATTFDLGAGVRAFENGCLAQGV